MSAVVVNSLVAENRGVWMEEVGLFLALEGLM